MNENIILQYFEHSSFRCRLLDIQQKLSSFTQLEFYTDGSLINMGTEQLSMTLGFIQTHNNAPYVKFISTIENWPLSNRTELAAIISALMVCPKFSNITIFTDSLSTILHYNKLLSSNFELQSRKFFNQSTNNISWAVLCDIIRLNQLSVSLIYVKGHSGDFYNTKIDTLIQTAHHDDLPLFKLNSSMIRSLRYIPR